MEFFEKVFAWIQQILDLVFKYFVNKDTNADDETTAAPEVSE